MERLPIDYTALKGLPPPDGETLATARARMAQAEELLEGAPPCHCPADCCDCCQGTILMSYYEYVTILDYLLKEAPAAVPGLLTDRLGVLKEGRALLCPFLQDGFSQRHCSIYPARPLICRVYGTLAAPCHLGIESAHLGEDTYDRAHKKVHLDEDGELTGLYLDDDLVLCQAPFDLWLLVDLEGPPAAAVLAYFREDGESLGAVLLNPARGQLFALQDGREIPILE